MSNTLPGGPLKSRTTSERMMCPVDDTGRNSVRPSMTPITSVFQISARSIPSILETFGARPAFFGHAAGLRPLAPPELELGGRNQPIGPRQTVRQFESLCIRKLVGLRLLQQHAAATSHLRYLLKGKDQEFAPLTQGRNRIGTVRHDRKSNRLLLVGKVQHLLAV